MTKTDQKRAELRAAGVKGLGVACASLATLETALGRIAAGESPDSVRAFVDSQMPQRPAAPATPGRIDNPGPWGALHPSILGQEWSSHTPSVVLAAAIRANVPVLLWGAPGIAKTATCYRLAAAAGMPLVDVRGTTLTESDLGIPVPSADAEYIDRRILALFRPAIEGPALVLVDELTCVQPPMMAGLLGILQERRVGDVKFHPDARFIGAANPPDIAVGGYDLPTPARGRFCHVAWYLDAAIQSEYLKARAAESNAPTAALLALFAGPSFAASGKAGDATQYATDSPRTREMAARVAGEVLAMGYGQEDSAFAAAVAGCVGPTTASSVARYFTWNSSGPRAFNPLTTAEEIIGAILAGDKSQYDALLALATDRADQLATAMYARPDAAEVFRAAPHQKLVKMGAAIYGY